MPPATPIDPDNPVIKVCAAGRQAEIASGRAEALALFTEAWEAATDDYDACVAAHFVARHQADPRDMLHWNQVALEHAQTTGDEQVHGFYPSLYLNLGYAFENLGDLAGARRCYSQTAARAGSLDEGSYWDVVKGGIAAGLARLEAMDVAADPPGP